MPKDSWTFLGSRPISDHRILQVRHDLYRFEPTGVEREFVVIDAPDWVNVVPITEDGRVVLIRQYRHGIRAVTLEIPGGIIDPGERPEAAAIRELREETGYAAQRITALGRTSPNPAIQGNHQYVFLAENCRAVDATNFDAFEDIEVELHDLDEIPELIRREEICHSLVINAFAMMAWLRRSG